MRKTYIESVFKNLEKKNKMTEAITSYSGEASGYP